MSKRAREGYIKNYQEAKKRRLVSRQNALLGRPNSLGTPYRSRQSNLRSGGYMNRGELRFEDYEITNDTMLQTWAGGELDTIQGCISGLTRDDSENGRTGRQYVIKSIFIRGFFKLDALEGQGAPDEDKLIRLALVLDTQTNGAQLNAEDVFIAQGNGYDVMSVKNLENTQRFKVLKDKTYRINASAGCVNEGAVNSFARAGCAIPFKIAYNFGKGLKVNCKDSTSNSVAQIIDNSLHLIGCTQGDAVKMNYVARMRFYP